MRKDIFLSREAKKAAQTRVDLIKNAVDNIDFIVSDGYDLVLLDKDIESVGQFAGYSYWGQNWDEIDNYENFVIWGIFDDGNCSKNLKNVGVFSSEASPIKGFLFIIK